MRITIFDDNGDELAQGSVRGLKLDSQRQSVEITANVVTSWHSLSEGGGRSVSASISALMDYLAASGKTVVSYSSGSLHGSDVNFGSSIAAVAARGLAETFGINGRG